MTLNDVLNRNAYKMRHKDHFVVILKSADMCFTLGENRYHAWIENELEKFYKDLILQCINEEVKVKVDDKIDFKLFKCYINNYDLQIELYMKVDEELNNDK